MSDLLIHIKTLFRKDPVLAVATVLACISMIFVVPSKEYLSYIDFKTLACLFCLMVSVKGLEREGILERISIGISGRLKKFRTLVLFLVFSCFAFSMLITNDVALIAIIPITFSVLSVCGLEEWSAFIVVLQTIAANIGSGLTPIGNPQNLFIFNRYHIPLLQFIMTMLPIVITGGLFLAACCMFIPAVRLNPPEAKVSVPLRRKQVIVYGVLFVLSAATVFNFLPYAWITAVVFVMVLVLDNITLKRVDYKLLLTFLVIFIFVGNMSHIPPVHWLLSSLTHKSTLLTAIFTSQLTSNVPAAILLSGFTENSRELLAGVNIGGMGTLIASMASVITYKIYISIHPGQTARFMKLFSLWNILFLTVLTVLGLIMSSMS